ncbi:MAG: ribosomal protein L7/L12 [Enhygromyxa sp.]
MIRHHVRSFGSHKIMAIKLVRELTSCGLKEAKDHVEQQTGFLITADARSQARIVEDAASYGIEFDPPLDGTVASLPEDPIDPGGTYAVRYVSGPNLIPAIKLVRELTGLGLKEAKDVVTECKLVRTELSRAEAEELVRRFAEIGARADLIAARDPAPGGRLHDYQREEDYDF